MSHAIAHRPHVHHVPWTTVLAVLLAVISVVAIVYALDNVSVLPASTSTPTPMASGMVAPTGAVAPSSGMQGHSPAPQANEVPVPQP